MNESTQDDQSFDEGQPVVSDWFQRERIEKVRRRVFGGDVLTVTEAAEVLGIHPRTVSEYIRDGKLQGFQLGGAWKITEEDLETFVRNLRGSPSTAS